MSLQAPTRPRRVRVIVLGNEKGGSGKSTVAMHVTVALLKANRRVATIDLDPQQKSLTAYVENRRAWAARSGQTLPIPDHLCIDPQNGLGNETAALQVLSEVVDRLDESHDCVVIDTPGHGSATTRQVYGLADTLVTPLNDSFVDFDVLGTVDPETFAVTGAGRYAQVVAEANRQRLLRGEAPTDWIVLRNRLSMLTTRNKRLVGDSLRELSQQLGFRLAEGLAERMIFRELFPRGLTACDDLDEATLGTRPTLSHMTARQEVEGLLTAMGLSEAPAGEAGAGRDRDAA